MLIPIGIIDRLYDSFIAIPGDMIVEKVVFLIDGVYPLIIAYNETF